MEFFCLSWILYVKNVFEFFFILKLSNVLTFDSISHFSRSWAQNARKNRANKTPERFFLFQAKNLLFSMKNGKNRPFLAVFITKSRLFKRKTKKSFWSFIFIVLVRILSPRSRKMVC
jgi:hypothetical protein